MNYEEELLRLPKEAWISYLLKESKLPGPRGNLELAAAVAKKGDESLFLELIEYTPNKAPVNTPEEFLHFCGVFGLGSLLLLGKQEYMQILRQKASDPRWRTREAVAMALQLYGETHMGELLEAMEFWADGNSYEQRAAAAALCEPRLLKDDQIAVRVLKILECIANTIVRAEERGTIRKSEEFIALKKGMGYCISVAAVGCPAKGKAFLEAWAACEDRDMQWIIKENFKKKRLERMDSEWCCEMRGKIERKKE